MLFSQTTRKLVLLAHILSSVGWIGAVAAFLALAITGVRSSDPRMVHAVCVAMEPMTCWVIVPLAFTSLATGVLLSLGTKWGLLRHYWVIMKLVINALSLPILLLHVGIIHRVARTFATADMNQLVVAAIASLAALLLATFLSVFKPRGLTRYGWVKQDIYRMFR